MNTPRKGPRAGSRAYLALAQLYKDGGQATHANWMRSTSWSGAVAQFDRVVVDALVGHGLVFKRDDLYLLADLGAEYLGIAPDAPPLPAPVIVAASYVAPQRELSPCNRPRVRIMREGAFDYRDIPSLQGSQRTPFQTSLKVASGDANG
jgi:hypothetical protein